jgi:hypothetical protein
MPLDQTIVRRFNRYARLGPRTLGIDPALRIDLRTEERGGIGGQYNFMLDRCGVRQGYYTGVTIDCDSGIR